MDKWRLHFVLLIAVSTTFVCKINATTPDPEDEDDGISIESEKIVIFFHRKTERKC